MADAGARLLPMGTEAVLVEVAGTASAVALRDRLRGLVDAGGAPWHAVREVVAAARTVLVVLGAGAPVPPGAVHDVGRACLDVAVDVAADVPADVPADAGADAADDGPPEDPDGPVVEVPVRYDGPDLDEVARVTGLSREEVVRAHTGRAWRVGFGGFAPGFAYLVGGDPRLRVPRRAEPRPRVPAGSVALAGEFSGVYPQDSPGGWQLLGTTDAVLWDPQREPPALLRPGVSVRFVDATAREPAAGDAGAAEVVAPAEDVAPVALPRPEEPSRPPSRPSSRGLEVLATGPLALVEDLGRPGFADVGVGRSGAADRGAHLLGLRLVGHAIAPGDTGGPATLEVVLGGLAVRARGDLLVALTGAPAPAGVDGRPVAHAAPVPLRDGQVLELGTPGRGLRTYLAVRGGIAAAPVLGSRSADTLSGLGPAPLRPGDVLPVGPAPAGFPIVEQAALAGLPEEGGVAVLSMTPGPRADWCDLAPLAGSTFTVSARSNRVGLRLQGPPVPRAGDRSDALPELPSEPMVLGAVQVPPGGEPVLFLADHPVTGGYPVVAVVTRRDVDRAAQLRPGARVRFRWA